MTIKKFLSILVLVLFAALPAAADDNRMLFCTAPIAFAAASDNFAVALAPYGGAQLLRAACYTDANAITPAEISFEDGAANAVTHGTLTCGENGTSPSWVTATAANSFLAGEPIVLDVDNAADSQQYTICLDLKIRQ